MISYSARQRGNLSQNIQGQLKIHGKKHKLRINPESP